MPVDPTQFFQVSADQGFAVAVGGFCVLFILGMAGWAIKRLIDGVISQLQVSSEFIQKSATHAELMTKSLEKVQQSIDSGTDVLRGLVAKVEGNIIREDERHVQNERDKSRDRDRQDQLWEEMITAMRSGMTGPRRQEEQRRESAKRVRKAMKGV